MILLEDRLMGELILEEIIVLVILVISVLSIIYAEIKKAEHLMTAAVVFHFIAVFYLSIFMGE